MQQIYRLKKNYQYNYVYKHSESVVDANFVVLYCGSKNPQTKVGFSISKKYGKAVKRNRLRRQLKSAVAKIMPSAKGNFNVVIIPRKSRPFRFAEIENSVANLFAKAGILQ